MLKQTGCGDDGFYQSEKRGAETNKDRTDYKRGGGYSEIGRKLNFTRRNLYNYFRCKEDIFLTLLLQDIENMVEDAEKTFTEPVEDQENFCLAWAGMLLRHQRMLALFGIVNTVILKDATSDMHRSFRIEMNRSFNRLKAVVPFPNFPKNRPISLLSTKTAMR